MPSLFITHLPSLHQPHLLKPGKPDLDMFSYLTFHVSYLYLTRNTHAHLCIASVRRLRAGIICGCRWGTHGSCWPRRSCLVLVVSKMQWPRCAVVPDLHLHRQRTLSSTHLSRAYLNVSDCVTHIAYTYGMKQHSVWHSWAWPTMYVHMYFVRIDPRFRASCSAIISFHWRGSYVVYISPIDFWGQHLLVFVVIFISCRSILFPVSHII